MSSQRTTELLCIFLLAFVCVLLSACSRSGQPQPQAFAPPPPEEGAPDLRPPQPVEVEETIKRVYGQTVTVEAGRAEYFLAGDFNGDGASDLAVVVRPAAGKLAELNHELANWIRGDPLRVELPDPRVHVRHLSPTTEPIIIGPDELLLAIVHGYGPRGWRHAQARQSYLLRHAVGTGLELRTLSEAVKLAKGASLPLQLRGDVIKQTFESEPGLLFYTGAKYAWRRLGAAGAQAARRSGEK